NASVFGAAPIFTVPSRDGPFPELTYRTGQMNSTDYTVGLRYTPTASLALRASFGTGFLPPSVMQIASGEALVTTAQQASFLFSGFSGGAALDPKRGNTPAYVGQSIIGVSGGRSDLKPELSESWSAGLILTPQLVPGLR